MQEKSGHVASSSYASSASKTDGRLPDTPPFGLFSDHSFEAGRGVADWLRATSAFGAERFGYLAPFAYYTNGSTMVSTWSIFNPLGSECLILSYKISVNFDNFFYFSSKSMLFEAKGLIFQSPAFILLIYRTTLVLKLSDKIRVMEVHVVNG